ncbi:MAG: hypothetical protein ACI3XM_11745 [Eubacteriales bacterium]
MKKDYVKPEIHYESFVLSQHIAVCGWDMKNSMDKNHCTATGDVTFGHFPVELFTEFPRCSMLDTDAEGYCYETSSGEMGLFNS